MKKLLLSILTFSFFYFFISSSQVYASTEVYKITDPFSADPPPAPGMDYAYFYNSVGFDYKGGTVIISKNPDGTGLADIGDTLQIGFIDLAPSITFKGNSANCQSSIQLPPTDITNNFKRMKYYLLQVTFLDSCGKAKQFSSLYVVIKNIPETVPSITPSPTATEPFLDLPWDYENKGLSFNDAALSMTSFFDHTYPLLSTSLNEPDNFKGQVTTFNNELSTIKQYSSHDGYDYSKRASVNLDDPVLAAAPGEATYIDTCSKCGNMIIIDHKNGYQTRYMHLQKDGLITSTPNVKVAVSAKQEIGRVGATGNVIPSGNQGAHIHFMVIHDKDKDGNFDNNLPDGIVDPFGWQSSAPDPWENYSFIYQDKQKIGDKSQYLWKKSIEHIAETITRAESSLNSGNYSLHFPENTFTEPMKVSISFAPILNLPDKSSLGPVMIALARDPLGRLITLFQNYVLISVDFSRYNLSSVKPETLSIYSSSDGVNWTKEETIVDLVNKNATTKVNHFTHFALMGERKDRTAPTTKIHLRGLEGSKNWFRSEVEVTLESKDDKKGLGVDYTIYKIDENDWTNYTTPFTVTGDGLHTIKFYSVDSDQNVELANTKDFSIDTTLPEAKISYNRVTSKIQVIPEDQSSSIQVKTLPNKTKQVLISDKAKNTMSFTYKSEENKVESKLTILNMLYSDCSRSSFTKAVFKVEHELDKKKFYTVFNQILHIDNYSKVKMIYKPKVNKSVLTTYENGNISSELNINGLNSMILTTAHGELLFSY